jgi:aspartyl-tRNA(Asn)/glutamyl-tRNA(Gln) amidotransferase subunit A
MHKHTIKQLSSLLQAKEVSATELAKHYLDRIQRSDLNAFLHVDEALTLQLTLQQASTADQRIAQGTGTVLTGIPIAHKDIFVTQGWRSTAGSKMLANYTSPFDATVVEQFNAAGTVTLGKLNCDEFAMGSANENSFFGPVKNPWDKTAVPGGSSGGSGAAVAARLAPAATGTDTGGSIRQPAATRAVRWRRRPRIARSC